MMDATFTLINSTVSYFLITDRCTCIIISHHQSNADVECTIHIPSPTLCWKYNTTPAVLTKTSIGPHLRFRYCVFLTIDVMRWDIVVQRWSQWKSRDRIDSKGRSQQCSVSRHRTFPCPFLICHYDWSSKSWDEHGDTHPPCMRWGAKPPCNRFIYICPTCYL